MGVVTFDVKASSRRLEAAFPLHTEEGVRAFLEKIHNLESLKYTAVEYEVAIWLTDFYDTMASVGLSKTEHKILYFLYFEAYKQSELVDLLGLKKNTIHTLMSRGIKKIAMHYERVDGEILCK